MRKKELSNLMNEIKKYLRVYLEEHGRNISVGGKFKCINSEHHKHGDAALSAGIIPGTDGCLWKCFTENLVGDIFTAAYFLEGKPIKGKKFLFNNVKYLADKYKIEYNPDVFMYGDDNFFLQSLEVYRAYEHAYSFFNGKFDARVKHQSHNMKGAQYIESRGWTTDDALKQGLGYCNDYNEYMDHMTKVLGYTKKFLNSCDLDNEELFSSKRLLFTIFDQFNKPIAFVGRHMFYEELTEEEQLKHNKYWNTSSKCIIYKKKSTLYGLNDMYKHIDIDEPLYIFEGYADKFTASKYGLHNSVALGGTAFTDEHFDIIRNFVKYKRDGTAIKIKEIILALDSDNAGISNTLRILERLSYQRTLRIKILDFQEYIDGDTFFTQYADSNPLSKFKDIPIDTPFSWRIKQIQWDNNDNYEDKLSEMINYICMESNSFITRDKMTQQLAKISGYDLNILRKEVDRLWEYKNIRKQEEIQSVVKEATYKLNKEKDSNKADILRRSLKELETIEEKYSKDDDNEVFISLENYFNDILTTEKREGYKTNFKRLDNGFDLIPQKEVLIGFAGGPNVGKTALMVNLIQGLLENNHDLTVFFMTIDDSRTKIANRFIASWSKIPINICKRPVLTFGLRENNEFVKKNGVYVFKDSPEFAAYNNAKQKLMNYIHNERLIIKDATHGMSLDYMELVLKKLKDKGHKNIVCVLDNFHKLSGTGDERLKNKLNAERIKSITTLYGVTILMTIEFTKIDYSRGYHPHLNNMAETVQIEYELDGGVIVYNELHAQREKAKIYHTDKIALIYPSDTYAFEKKPIIELSIEKNKISGFKGNIFYKLHGSLAFFEEMTFEEQLQVMKTSNYHSGIETVMNNDGTSLEFDATMFKEPKNAAGV